MTSEHRTGPAAEPTITRAELAPGHDGRAELFVEVAYPSGGRTQLTLDTDTIAAAVTEGKSGTVDDLVGRPWHALIGGTADIDALTGRADGAEPTHRSPH